MASIPKQSLDRKERLFNLFQELSEAKEEKRSVTKAHNENIKRIEAEMKDVLDEEDGEIQSSQKEI